MSSDSPMAILYSLKHVEATNVRHFLWIGIPASLVGINLIVFTFGNVFITPIDGRKCSLKQQHWKEE